MVAQRQVGQQKRHFVRHRLQAVAAAADELEDVGILLVGHDARSRGEVVGQRYEAEILAHEEAQIHRQPSDGGRHGGDGRGGGALALAATHLRRDGVVVERPEAEQAGRHRAVERERRTVARGRAEGVLVGDLPGGGHQPQVVDERFGIGAEPEAERRGHGDLEVGVARHQHLAIALRELLQPVEEGPHVARHGLQLVAQEEFQIDQHLVVARASRVDLLAHVAQAARQQQFDLRVDVLDLRFDAEIPRLDLGGDRFEPLGQTGQFVGRQEADRFEHADVGQRAADVVARQAQVERAVFAHGVAFDQRVRVVAFIPEFGCHKRLRCFR